MQLTPSDDDFESRVEVGQMVGERYQVVRFLGRGGVGAVYEAENVLIGRRVALKVLLSHRASSRSALKRFAKEARVTGQIESDHILDVIDIGTLATGEPFLVMELLLGEDLRERLLRIQKLPAGQLVPLARQALLGLRAAHQAGIVHRDLKPANIFIIKSKAGQPDFVKLIDFGVSKFADPVSNTSVTKPGAIMGTPVYMSPEQAQGDGTVDSRSDIYAMGVILYEALTGQLPFPGKSYNELLFQIVLKPPRPLDATVDAHFRAIVEKAMARNPDDRFQSCEAFIAALDEFSGAKSMRMAQSLELPGGELEKTGKMPAIHSASNQSQGTVPMAVPRLDALPVDHPAFVASRELLDRQPVETVPHDGVEEGEPPTLPLKKTSASVRVMVGLLLVVVLAAAALTSFSGAELLSRERSHQTHQGSQDSTASNASAPEQGKHKPATPVDEMVPTRQTGINSTDVSSESDPPKVPVQLDDKGGTEGVSSPPSARGATVPSARVLNSESAANTAQGSSKIPAPPVVRPQLKQPATPQEPATPKEPSTSSEPEALAPDSTPVEVEAELEVQKEPEKPPRADFGY